VELLSVELDPVDLDPVELDPVYSYILELGPMKCMGPMKLNCVGFDHEKLDTVEIDPV
jgi:hypothetical protein